MSHLRDSQLAQYKVYIFANARGRMANQRLDSFSAAFPFCYSLYGCSY